ncbi:hypothetical protein [Solirubrobacter soli]|uniref:hypothetical protein n=1 Tax=Solirubrobacter soli TaxID=363832 RepID=UPI000407BF6B|nr:hypothetical protein [Solirubrobacter soli]
MATERTSDSVHVAAVAEARRVRGSVNLDPADGRRWSAIVSAIDGSLELRVSEPRKRRFWRNEGPELNWLIEHGFTKAYDCWVLPFDAATPDEEVAERWIETLAGAHGLAADEVEPGYPGRGVPEDDVPPASAPHADHLAVALHAIVRGEFNRMNVFGGRPSELWAWVWDVVDEPGLRVERQHRDDPDNEIDQWHIERSQAGCINGAEQLLRQIEGDWPDARRVPLFIHLLTPREG